MSHLDERTRYTITVEGTIDPSLADWCGPLTLTTAQAPGGVTITTMSGITADQAGLVGIIRHLHGLGIVLLTVERCAESPFSSHAHVRFSGTPTCLSNGD